ncbi:MAG: hypothetical protein K1000chlam3_01007 [Chlamydiae bacterium]|nr:hypothetical protein [Chlamydiota bacterium]
MKKILLATILSSARIIAQETPEVKTPEQIQAELDKAQADFEIAQKMFIPWYTGPLITGSANNVPAGKWNIQPYLFFLLDHAQYNDNRKSINVPDIWTIQPLLVLQRGLNSWLDATLVQFGLFKWREGEKAQEYGDLNLTLGHQLVNETPYVPSIRVTIGESFPTGHYQKLSPDKAGIDASGSGAFATIVGLFVSKIFWEIPIHPVRVRFAGTYEIPNHDVLVKNFNAFGGGFGTNGDVSVGQTLNLDLGIEVSLTEHWVFATDFAYAYSRETTFKGNPGLTALGTPASVGGPSSDQFSIAPAIEYNISDRGGFIGGVWFSVTGRNSANFVGIILSYTWLF